MTSILIGAILTTPVIVPLPNTNTSDGSTVEHHSWNNGDDCVSVEHYKVNNGGHDWPGSFGNMDIDATEEIWNFVSRFQKVGGGCSTLIGDVNQDGAIDLLDVAPFIALLTDGGFQVEADINEDNSVDLLDVAPFVELLTGQ